MLRRTLSSLEVYAVKKTNSVHPLSLEAFTQAFFSVQNKVYFTPVDIIDTLRDSSLWSNSDEEPDNLSKNVLVEIVMNACLLTEKSFEGFTIFVLNSVITNEKVVIYFLLLTVTL